MRYLGPVWVRRPGAIQGAASGNGSSLGRLRMRMIKVVLLLGVVIAIVVWMLIYFSPYNSCIREGWSQEICEKGLD